MRPASPERPLLFLDVDGVLNCVGQRQDDHDHHMLGDQPVWVPAGTAERVTRLLEVFDPVWATAWLGSAHRSWRRVLGLTDMPWEYVDYTQMKLTVILRHAGERRWAWVDDDADWELEQLGWTRSMVAGLIVVPSHETGLTDAHVDELVGWAAA